MRPGTPNSRPPLLVLAYLELQGSMPQRLAAGPFFKLVFPIPKSASVVCLCKHPGKTCAHFGFCNCQAHILKLCMHNKQTAAKASADEARGVRKFILKLARTGKALFVVRIIEAGSCPHLLCPLCGIPPPRMDRLLCRNEPFMPPLQLPAATNMRLLACSACLLS